MHASRSGSLVALFAVRSPVEPPGVLAIDRAGCGCIMRNITVWVGADDSRRNAHRFSQEWRSRRPGRPGNPSVLQDRGQDGRRRMRNTAGRFSNCGSCSNGISACSPRICGGSVLARRRHKCGDKSLSRFFPRRRPVALVRSVVAENLPFSW